MNAQLITICDLLTVRSAILISIYNTICAVAKSTSVSLPTKSDHNNNRNTVGLSSLVTINKWRAQKGTMLQLARDTKIINKCGKNNIGLPLVI